MSIKNLFVIAVFVAPLLAGQAALADVALTDDRSVDFVTKAAQNDMLELKSSELALSRSTNPQVIAYAKLMIKDHQRVHAGLAKAAKAQSIALPNTMDMNFTARFNGLEAKGLDFDAGYVSVQVEIHDETVNLYADFSKNALDGKLKAFAQKTLLVVADHKIKADELKVRLEEKPLVSPQN